MKMKRSLGKGWTASALAVLLWASGACVGAQGPDHGTGVPAAVPQERLGAQAPGPRVGMEVIDEHGARVGAVRRVVRSRDGRPLFALVSPGSTGLNGDEMVALDLRQTSPDGERLVTHARLPPPEPAGEEERHESRE